MLIHMGASLAEKAHSKSLKPPPGRHGDNPTPLAARLNTGVQPLLVGMTGGRR
jgi:hypothetical protein